MKKKIIGGMLLAVLLSNNILAPGQYVFSQDLENSISPLQGETAGEPEISENADLLIAESDTQNPAISDDLETLSDLPQDKSTADPEEIQPNENISDFQDVVDDTVTDTPQTTDQIPEPETTQYEKYSKYTVAALANNLGIDWDSNAKNLSVLAGITEIYIGTEQQNEIIRQYLLDNIDYFVSNNGLSDDMSQTSIPSQTDEDAIDPELPAEELELQTYDTQILSQPITAHREHDGISVNVSAPAGAFPDGTELSITPLIDSEYQKVQQQMSGELTENHQMIAFDISFTDPENGSEIQPNDGYTVQVSFDFSAKQDITLPQDPQDIQVYHLNDKDDDGKQTDEVVIEPVEIVENTDQTLTIQAQSFSVYTIVYQHQQESKPDFTREDITICDPNDSSKCITMMDRNLGATTNDITSTGSYGYHYQWGNNYGFANPGVNGSDAITDASTTTKAVRDDNYNNSGYYGTTFIKGTSSLYDYWSDNQVHNGLRGGAEDSRSNNRGYDIENNIAYNVTGRQGPCPDGYHIPSQGERGTILKRWTANYTGTTSNEITLYLTFPLQYFSNATAKTQLQEDFKIPFAGYRFNDAYVYEIGGYASLRSSSPNGKRARRFSLSSNEAHADYDGSRAAYSVRCFKDSALGFSSAASQVVFYDSDQTTQIWSGEVESGATAQSIKPSDPTKTGYKFLGWYESGASEPFDFDTLITGNLNLYAKYESLLQITHYPDSNVEYTLNKGRPTQQTFTAGTITISDGETTITMLDRNLGATAAGTGCEDSSRGDACYGDGNEFDVYGYHFQRGNNYGFKPCTGSHGCTDFPNGESFTGIKVTRLPEYSNSGYFGNTFIKVTSSPCDYWNDSVNNSGNHYDLWGGRYEDNTYNVNDETWKVTNPEERRGPCPEGFHVPSVGEWNKILNMLDYDNYQFDKGGAWNSVRNELLVPFAGDRDSNDAGVFALGYFTNLWSSSPYSASYPGSRRLPLGVDGGLGMNDIYRAYAFSVRCLHDSYQVYTPSSQTNNQSQNSGGGGAGVGDKPKIDDCPNGDYSDSYYDGICGEKDSSQVQNDDRASSGTEGEGSIDDNTDSLSNDDNLSSGANAKDIDPTEGLESNELQTAYERAVQNNIVDTNYIDNIGLQTSLTRIEMARILSRYAINILGEIPDETRTKNFADVSDYLDKLYDYSVSTSYQLGIMGINLPDNNFRPNDSVPRAEFATALSRMLYDTPDGQDEYWSTHINSLYNSGIITNTDPDLTETVGYVLIMLMRSADSR